MAKIALAKLYTDIVEIRDPIEPTEGGIFEAEVLIDMLALRKSHSPKQYFFREIGFALYNAMTTTETPKALWWVEFSEEAKRMFNLPDRQKLEI